MTKNFMGILRGVKSIRMAIILPLLVLVSATMLPRSVQAHVHPCTSECTQRITENHVNNLRPQVAEHTSNRFRQHREWLLGEFFENQVLPALMLFTEQLSSIAMHQTMAVGTFLDAKQQLETQRLLQELQVQAHKDYQPSEDFCWFGTNVKSLAASEANAKLNTYAFSRRQMGRHLGQSNLGGAEDRDHDKFARWELFRADFCDPQDSDWTAADTGLEALCSSSSSSNNELVNADIDYTRTIEETRTITLDGETGVSGINMTSSFLSASPAERAVYSLNNNLYGHNILTRSLKKDILKQQQYQEWYMALRSVAAKRSVAENSFNAIVGMKSEGSPQYPAGSASSGIDTYEFLGSIMVELGVPADEVRGLIGNRPSYYAQLEILAKRIYQNPDFYAGLYDKPANVKRKSVALKAIELMVDRAIYESQIRQEMLSSVLLSARLREPFKAAQRALTPEGN